MQQRESIHRTMVAAWSHGSLYPGTLSTQSRRRTFHMVCYKHTVTMCVLLCMAVYVYIWTVQGNCSIVLPRWGECARWHTQSLEGLQPAESGLEPERDAPEWVVCGEYKENRVFSLGKWQSEIKRKLCCVYISLLHGHHLYLQTSHVCQTRGNILLPGYKLDC